MGSMNLYVSGAPRLESRGAYQNFGRNPPKLPAFAKASPSAKATGDGSAGTRFASLARFNDSCGFLRRRVNQKKRLR